MNGDPLGEILKRYPDPLLSNEEILKLCEVVRCARGVVRTARPESVAFAVLPSWWRALRAALEQVPE